MNAEFYIDNKKVFELDKKYVSELTKQYYKQYDYKDICVFGSRDVPNVITKEDFIYDVIKKYFLNKYKMEFNIENLISLERKESTPVKELIESDIQKIINYNNMSKEKYKENYPTFKFLDIVDEEKIKDTIENYKVLSAKEIEKLIYS